MSEWSERGHQSEPVLLGRQSQLTWFAHRLQEALAGHPHVVLVPGAMGIGKSRLLTEVCALATQHQMQVCFGRCYEDLTLPYLPFVEMLREPWMEVADDALPTPESDAHLLHQFLHFDTASPPVVSASPATEGDQDRLRLFLVVTRTLVRLARRRPTLVVIDDLHWADQPSVDLFEHLAFTIVDAARRQAVPLLLVGTYRPEEPGTRLPLLLSRLQREALYDSVPLTGLDETETYALLHSLGCGRLSPQLVATIMELTQGNPLFIREVVQQLRQHEALQKDSGQAVLTSMPPTLQLPKQLTEAIRTRCLGLSAACQEILTRAAFLGDRFTVATLAAVCEAPPHEVLPALAEGLRQDLLRREGEEFQFAHALMRHVLYHQTHATQRQGLHLHLARTLEQVYGDSRDRHMLEIAHHLIRAGSVADSATVIQYARRAGDQAFAVFAWGEAARYYEAVLVAAAATALLSTHERAELHYWAGLAQYRNGDIERCLEHYKKAIELYRLTGDVRGLAQALMEQTRVYYRNPASYGTLIDIRLLEEVFEVIGECEPRLRGNIAATLSQTYWAARQTDKSEEMARHAQEIGHRLQDDRLCTQAGFALGLAHSQSLHLKNALESLQTALVHAQRTNDLWLQSGVLTRVPVVLAQLGRLDEAETIALRACDMTRSIHDWVDLSQALAILACVNVAKGNFEQAATYTRETVTVGSRSGYPWGCTRALYALTCAHVWRGAWAAAEEILDMLVTPGGTFGQIEVVDQTFTLIFRQLLQAHTGKRSAGRAPSVAEVLHTGGDDMYVLGPLCAIVEIGDLMARPAIAGAPYQVLSRAAEQGVVLSSWGIFLIPRILGVVAALNSLWEQAEEHFQAAIDTAMHMGAAPELGRSYLDYARMLRARGRTSDRPRALALAQRAGRVLKMFDMTPGAQQAAQLAEALQDRTCDISQQQAVARNGHRKEG